MNRTLLCIFGLAFLLVFTATTVAQTPQYYNSNTGTSSNSFPFATAAGKAVNSLFRAGEFNQPSPLPPGQQITTVYFRMATAGTRTFTNLHILMAQDTISSLTTATFYPGPYDTVYVNPSVSLSSTVDGWMAIALDHPFIYDPTKSLIMFVGHCGAVGTGMNVRNTTLTPIRRVWSVGGCPFVPFAGGDAAMINFGVDVTTTANNDYGVGPFVGIPAPMYEDSTYVIKARVTNNGTNAQTNVPVRFYVNGVQYGSDVLVSLASLQSDTVSYSWTPVTSGATNLKVKSFLVGDEIPSNDSVTTTVNVISGGPPRIAVAPDSLHAELTPTQTATREFTIRNIGFSPLDFMISLESVSDVSAKVDFIGDVPGASDRIISFGKPIPLDQLPAVLPRTMGAPPNIEAGEAGSTEPVDLGAPALAGPAIKRVSALDAGSLNAEEVFGSTQNVFGPAGARGRGNLFACTNSTVLTEHRLYLNMTAPSDMYFVVYEGTTVAGTYNLISSSQVNPSGTGQGWYSSGQISVPMVAGRYYMIFPFFVQAANYYSSNPTVPYPVPASFGQLIAGIGWHVAPTYAIPPPATQSGAGYVGDPVAYYQTIVTGAGTSWLTLDTTSGSIAAGDSMQIEVTFDAAGLVGGDYDAHIVIASNDPTNPEERVAAHLFVIGEVSIRTNPTSLNFGQTYVNTTDTTGLWVANDGNGQLSVTNITSSNPRFSVGSTSFNVPAFDSVLVNVMFSPTSLGPQSGSLTIASNDTSDPTINVPVQGEGVNPPVIGVTPDTINTQVLLGDSVDVPVQINNTGGAPLTWSAQSFLSRITMRTITLEPAATRTTAGAAEASPHLRDKAQQMTVFDAPFDMQFSFDLAIASGANGNAGAEFDGTYYYTTRWASNLLHKYTMAGALVEAFSIPGVTGLRDLAFDGTYMYGGAAATTIYQMDFVSKTLIGTITSPVAVRHIAYDPRFDGFWVGNWDTPVILINRSGQQLASLPNTLVAKYGSAYDDWTANGPYLWIFNQDLATGGSPQNVHQFNLNTLLPTGFTHNVWPDVPSGATAIAGGLWASEGVVAGKASLGGVMQGVPDYFFVYELAQATPTWMALVGTTSGTIPPGGNSVFTVRLYGVDSASLASHVFSGSVVVTSNAGDVTIPVTLDVVTGVNDQEGLPTVFSLDQNYPNPFNPTTTITYALPTESRVKVTVYDVVGREVARLVNEQQAAGTYEQAWDGRNSAGLQVGSGVYFYKLEATPGDGRPVYTNVKKMLMLK